MLSFEDLLIIKGVEDEWEKLSNQILLFLSELYDETDGDEISKRLELEVNRPGGVPYA